MQLGIRGERDRVGEREGGRKRKRRGRVCVQRLSRLLALHTLRTVQGDACDAGDNHPLYVPGCRSAQLGWVCAALRLYAQVHAGDGSQGGDGGLKITSSFVTDWKLYIIQELCDAGSLRTAILKQQFWNLVGGWVGVSSGGCRVRCVVLAVLCVCDALAARHKAGWASHKHPCNQAPASSSPACL